MSCAITLVRSQGHSYPEHPEGPERFDLLENWKSKPYRGVLHFLDVRPATRNQIELVHTQKMVDSLEQACKSAPMIVDYAPTYVSPGSFQDACLAAGAGINCVKAVLQGGSHNGFAIIRPPGHHAEPEAPMGFCLFNNIAIASQVLLTSGLENILIVDFDAHHGNGTQACFWQEQKVAYFSSHQEHIYPGSGRIDEAAHARGRLINLPLPIHAGDMSFQQMVEGIITPLVEKRKPEFILVSVGFDAHWKDPLTQLGVSTRGFYSIAKKLVDLAERTCQGRIVFFLEGGYLPEVLADGVDACLRAMTGFEGKETKDVSLFEEEDISGRINFLKQIHDL